MLGDLLGGALRASAALPQPLADEIRARQAEPEQFVRQCVARFERQATPEDWTTLMSRLPGAADPGTACLEFMVRWGLGGGPPPLDRGDHDDGQASG